jgi:hypothetical protein
MLLFFSLFTGQIGFLIRSKGATFVEALLIYNIMRFSILHFSKLINNFHFTGNDGCCYVDVIKRTLVT